MTRRSVTTPSAERSLHHCSLKRCKNGGQRKPCRDSENKHIKILLERQKEQILTYCRAKIEKQEFQTDNEGIEQRGEINRALERDEQLRRDR